jgi:hypothetical protein
MKHLKLLICLCPVLLLACNYLGDGNKDPESFIPGTYASYAEGEYSVSYDTLRIEPVSEQEGAYRIFRETAFRRIEDKKLKKLEHKSEKWFAVYDEQRHVLLERTKGKVISILPDAGLIVVGSREYHKLEKK